MKFFKIGLSFRFILLTTLLIILTSLTLSLFFINSKLSDYKHFFQNKGILTARLLAYNSEYGVLTSNTYILSKLIEGFLEDKDIIYALVHDKDGSILAKSIPPHQNFNNKKPSTKLTSDDFSHTDYLLNEIIDKKNDITIFEITCPIITKRVKRQFVETKLLPGYLGIIEQIKSRFRMEGVIIEEMIGFVKVGVSLSRINSIINRFKQTITLITLLVTSIGVLITILLVRIIIRPIKRLVYGTRQIARGDLTYEVKIRSHDEIGELAYSFNQMTNFLKRSRDQIEDYSRTLEEKVEERTRQLEAAEAELIRSEKFLAIGELIAGITHELNNKLTPILGYVEVFRMLKPDQKIMKIVDIIEESGLAAKNIVESLLKYSRPTPPKEEYINLNEVLKKTLNLVDPLIKTDLIKMTPELDQSLPKTIADGGQISQAFLNILNNACQEIENKPDDQRLLIVRSYHDKTHIFFSFVDTGRGISKENLIKIFDPFFSTKEIGKGTGLGLSISYGIIKAHQGTIHVESRIGKGTTFTIELPIKKRYKNQNKA
ncbi:sensor histidine kinase [Chlamydiota bacterium]